MTEFEEYKQLLAGNAKDLVFNEIEKKEQIATDRWTGIVVENNDPQRLGRVQIRIIGFYDDIPDYLLPWAIPDISFIGSTKGSFIIPEINSTLRGYFDKGDVQKPIYDSLAFSKEISERNSLTILDENEYPNKMVLLETDQGDFLTLNRRTGEMVFIHRTGVTTSISQHGDISIRTGSQAEKNGNLSVEILGNANINANGNVEISSNKDINVKSVTGSINLGNNTAKQLVNNIPFCFICGAKHAAGNTQVKV